MFLVDRKKEMIIVGGYNVYPREIDELLFKHPAILEAATVGVPDSFSGEAVKVVCRAQGGRQSHPPRSCSTTASKISSSTNGRSTSHSSTRCRAPASARSTNARSRHDPEKGTGFSEKIMRKQMLQAAAAGTRS